MKFFLLPVLLGISLVLSGLAPPPPVYALEEEIYHTTKEKGIWIYKVDYIPHYQLRKRIEEYKIVTKERAKEVALSYLFQKGFRKGKIHIKDIRIKNYENIINFENLSRLEKESLENFAWFRVDYEIEGEEIGMPFLVLLSSKDILEPKADEFRNF